MAHNDWSEGPTLKFLADEPYPCGRRIQLWLAAVGNSFFAVYQQAPGCAMYMSTLVDNEWSEPIAIGPAAGEMIFSMVALDEKHFALQHITLHSSNEAIQIVNVDTASVVTTVPMDWMCYHGFLYNGQFSCIRQGEIWS